MRQAIAFSLFGDHAIYNIGLCENIQLANKFYSDYDIHIYHDNSINCKLLSLAEDKILFHYIDCPKVPGYFWRFFLVDDKTYDVVLSRDLDSRLSLREKVAVDQWIESGKTLHIMRDHPGHDSPIMAGMWGVRPQRIDFSFTDSIRDFSSRFSNIGNKESDQIYLEQIFSSFQNDVLAHDDWLRCGNSVCFPTERTDERFVGEIYDEFNNPKYRYTADGRNLSLIEKFGIEK